MGRLLGERILAERPSHGIDVVVPVPDSGRIAALELARTMGVQYREGFVKNRYIGRTFIMPGQSMRKDSVRKKLNTMSVNSPERTFSLWMTASLGETPPNGLLRWQDLQVQRRSTSRVVHLL